MSPQKYRYVKGRYREFRGYVFANFAAVTVSDRGTLEAIQKQEGFEKVKDETKEETTVLDSKACPKCGKVFLKGRYMHEKYCKG